MKPEKFDRLHGFKKLTRPVTTNLPNTIIYLKRRILSVLNYLFVKNVQNDSLQSKNIKETSNILSKTFLIESNWTTFNNMHRNSYVRQTLTLDYSL